MASSNTWTELNATEPDFGDVNQNSTDDQGFEIQEAFKRVGKSVTIDGETRYFSKTIYFPAGTYLFSEQLLDLNLDPNPDVVPNITIRGDGPGRTILKLYSNAFQLSNFANTDWVSPNSTELSVPDTASGSTIDSKEYAPVIGASATRLYVSVRMQNAS